MTTSACGGSACIAGVSRDCGHGIFWLEGGATRSQTRRDTNFAIPGYSISAMIPRRAEKIKIFLSVVIPVVKAAFVPLSAIGENPANASVARLCGVLPCLVSDTATALPNQARYQLRYTRIFTFLPLYHGREENQRFFCLWSILWSKPLLCRFRQSEKIPQTQASQGFAAFRLAMSRIAPRHSQPRVLSAELHPDIQFLPLYHGREENQRFFCLWPFQV